MTTTTPLLLMQTAISELRGATMAGNNVFGPRDWPTWNGQYPCILIRPRLEEATGQGRSSVGFMATTTLQIVCRTSSPSGDSDVGTSTAEDQAWALLRQVQVTVINSAAIAELVQQYPSMRSELFLNTESENAIVDISLNLGLEYYLNATDFAPVTGPELTEMRIATNQSDFQNGTENEPGLDLTYTS